MGGLANPLLELDLQLGQPLPRRRDPRLEFRLLEQPVAVSMDQPRNQFLYIIDQFVDLLHLPARTRLLPLPPPLVLRADPLGLGQEMTHIVPDGRIQHIGADLLIPAQALAAESVGVGTGATIVGVRDLAFALGRGPARRLAVAAVTAPLADNQALKQVTGPTESVATTSPVLLELGPSRLEELRAHQPRDINRDLIFGRCLNS